MESNKPSANYLAYAHGALLAPQGTALEDGRALASQCISQLDKQDDPEQFPPRLLLLLVSAAFLEQSDATQLLEGIQQRFAEYSTLHKLPAGDVPLLGCSVAAVVFKHPDLNHRVHEQGAVLICLASRLIEVKVKAGHNARHNPKDAINSLLTQLELNEKDPNPHVDRIMLSFFPYFGELGGESRYPAPELHRRLREGVRARIRIAGGVASPCKEKGNGDSLLFAGREVITDAVVTALVITGVPIGIGLDHGLTPTGRVVRVEKLGADNYTIEQFDSDLSPATILREKDGEKGGYALLGRLTTSSEPLTNVPRITSDGRSIRLAHEVREGDLFELLQPEQENILKAVVKWKERLLINKSLLGLLLICNAWRLFYQDAGVDVEAALEQFEKSFGLPFFGGFVDGEAGVDNTSRSVFGNGGVACLILGDEMRERTPADRGFVALAKHSPKMTGTQSIEEAVKEALDLILEAGFRGAMLSLVFKNGDSEYIKPVAVRGRRYKLIFEKSCRKLHKAPTKDEYLMARIVREAREVKNKEYLPGKFIDDARKSEHGCSLPEVEESGLVSLYVSPLIQLDGQVLGTLHVDLGDLRDLEDMKTGERKVLDSLVPMIGTSLNRILNGNEANIGRQLDDALFEALNKNTLESALQHLIEKAIEAFRVEMGHVCLALIEQETLILVAGCGSYYKAAKKKRPIAKFDDNLPFCEAYRNKKETMTQLRRCQSTMSQ